MLGANDGLVSNLSISMGVAGASSGGHAVLIAGLAGMLAGALSMAIGEWLSVQSARELYAHQVKVERDELLAVPDEEEEELVLIYQSKGLTNEQARLMSQSIVGGDIGRAVDTLAREELGIDPDELGGSAWVAAGTSFLLFALGAIVPILAVLLRLRPDGRRRFHRRQLSGADARRSRDHGRDGIERPPHWRTPGPPWSLRGRGHIWPRDARGPRRRIGICRIWRGEASSTTTTIDRLSSRVARGIRDE